MKMARSRLIDTDDSTVPSGLRRFVRHRLCELGGLCLLGLTLAVAVSLASWSVMDPSLSHAVDATVQNWLGALGAIVADLLMQGFGLGVIVLLIAPLTWATRMIGHDMPRRWLRRIGAWLAGSLLASLTLSLSPAVSFWPLPSGIGGEAGTLLARPVLFAFNLLFDPPVSTVMAGVLLVPAMVALVCSAAGISTETALRVTKIFGDGAYEAVERCVGALSHLVLRAGSVLRRPPPPAMRHDKSGGWKAFANRGLVRLSRARRALKAGLERDDGCDPVGRIEPKLMARPTDTENRTGRDREEAQTGVAVGSGRVTRGKTRITPGKGLGGEAGPPSSPDGAKSFELPPLTLLAEPKRHGRPPDLSARALEQNARRLESVLEDFGVRGRIIDIRPGPVVTLYALEPAPGIKSARVIGLADDIARSMCAVSARVAVVPGRNVIGIELPNPKREVVYLRELLGSRIFAKIGRDIALVLGKNIGGEPIFADLARMPHLLIAGTTGSGKSVGVNAMILSLLYRLTPEQCKLILIDPKMLELSIYEGIPHLLSPVVTDPKKAVIALKWAVREMESRYRAMSRIGVRNIDGYNQRLARARKKNQALTRTVQTGFDPQTGQPIYESEEMALEPMPYIVIVVDEMADLMMVAGKDIEGAVQRLAQMARAAGLHLVTATQRPSVDVITGTIKANFPTRISFQVTSRIDSRTILGEQGAEQLLGQGDMLYMAGGGRITRLHGAFVSDEEVERVVKHLKTQGEPDYLEDVTEDTDEAGPLTPGVDARGTGSGDDQYNQAVAIVLRDRKASTSYVQRRLQIGYNRAASLIERMEREGIITPANHAGKRDILLEHNPSLPSES